MLGGVGPICACQMSASCDCVSLAMQICGSKEETEFPLTDWKRHAQTLLSQHNPLLLGKAFARLVWCNPKQPRFASVYCKVVKEPGALVLTEPGEDLKACQCCTS